MMSSCSSIIAGVMKTYWWPMSLISTSFTGLCAPRAAAANLRDCLEVDRHVVVAMVEQHRDLRLSGVRERVQALHRRHAGYSRSKRLS